jgi:membrane-bound lytic murein transglycosylase F
LRVIFAVVVGAFLGSCTPNLSLVEQIRLLGELRVVTKNAPTTFYNGANERHGIEYELARAFADHLGVRLRLTEVDQIEQLVPTVLRQDVHIAAGGITATGLLDQLIDFGPGYQQIKAQLIYRRGAPRPRSLSETANHSVEIQAGSSHIDALRRAAMDTPGFAWAEYRSTSAEPLIRRVADGTIDFAIVNSNEFNMLRPYYPNARVAFDLDSRGELAWALPENALELKEEVGAFFARIEASGELDQILDRYYVARREFDFVDQRAFVRHLKERLPALRPIFEEAQHETGIDWRLLAAMAYQESHWNPDAVSPTGVKGVMMLTANTAKLVGVKNRSDARESILGGARYLASVIEMFPGRIADEDRKWMAVAAYNIGWGHVEDARIITESRRADKDSWEDVRSHLPLLADEAWYPHLDRGYAQGSVPAQYVDNVRHYYQLLDGMTATEAFFALAQPAENGKDAI